MSEREDEIPNWIRDSKQLTDFLYDMVVRLGHVESQMSENEIGKKFLLPEFLSEALGPKLTHLPTFRINETISVKVTGFARLIDAVHREVRTLGRNVGKTLLPELSKIGMNKPPEPKCPFAAGAKKLKDRLTAKAEIRVGNKAIQLKLRGERIALKGMCAFVGSRTILQREGKESALLTNNFGVGLDAYGVVREVAHSVFEALRKQHEEYAALDLESLGLDIQHKDLLSKKATAVQADVRTAYNFLQGLTLFESEVLKTWITVQEKKPAKQLLYTSTPNDITAAFCGLVFYCLKGDSNILDKCNHIAVQLNSSVSLRESAEILNTPLAKSLLQKLRPAYISPLHQQITEELKKFRELQLKTDKYPGKSAVKFEK